MWNLSRRSFRRMNGTKSIVVAINVEGIKDAPVDYGIAWKGGLRLVEVQQSLFKIGRRGVSGEKTVTNCDGVTDISDHQEGKAWDIFVIINGKISQKLEDIEPVARHIIKVAKEKFGITVKWGGDWNNPDPPHLYIVDERY